ncbi:MAG: IS30 family transposase [Bacteroides sp.]|nr:IS30 family transposase [Bacillota bacterium]MCM1393619.1 IS30 family transposase [[Eubacterium] siraeum]MCM1454965.1 IS30 family transposase [Bacteroides sp.]
MKKRGTKNLTYTQRLQLEAYLRAKLSKKEIAEKLGVCLATVYNELKRGSYQHLDGQTWKYETRYSPNKAQDLCDMNSHSKGAPLKIGNDYEFVRYVEKRVLVDKLSPCAVLGEIKRKGLPFQTQISKTTLYRYIEMGLFYNIDLQDLPLKSRPKKHKRTTIAKSAPKGISIENRPNDINARDSFGHWEMDCVVGASKTTLLVLSERLTRKEIIMQMPNKKTESVIRCLNILERRYGKMFRQVFRSITVDNGTEFSDCIGLERSIYRGKRTIMYYCHPYSSYERGTNERLNREIRRLLPKGVDLAKFTKEEIQAVEDWVNNYPRQVLDFATSNELFKLHCSYL